MGRLADRFGIRLPLIIGAVMLGLGYVGRGACRQPTGSSSWRRRC